MYIRIEREREGENDIPDPGRIDDELPKESHDDYLRGGEALQRPSATNFQDESQFSSLDFAQKYCGLNPDLSSSKPRNNTGRCHGFLVNLTPKNERNMWV